MAARFATGAAAGEPILPEAGQGLREIGCESPGDPELYFAPGYKPTPVRQPRRRFVRRRVVTSVRVAATMESSGVSSDSSEEGMSSENGCETDKEASTDSEDSAYSDSGGSAVGRECGSLGSDSNSEGEQLQGGGKRRKVMPGQAGKPAAPQGKGKGKGGKSTAAAAAAAKGKGKATVNKAASARAAVPDEGAGPSCSSKARRGLGKQKTAELSHKERKHLIKKGNLADKSWQSYREEYRQLKAWAASEGYTLTKLKELTVDLCVRYLRHMSDSGKSVSKINQASKAMSWLWERRALKGSKEQAKGFEGLCANLMYKNTLARARNVAVGKGNRHTRDPQLAIPRETYSDVHFEAIMHNALNGGSIHASRDRCQFSMMHAGCGRCDDVTQINLTHFHSADEHPTIGPCKAHVMSFALQAIKNDPSTIRYLCFIEHLDAKLCPVVALGMYLMQRFSTYDQWPDLLDGEDAVHTYLNLALFCGFGSGAAPDKALQYDTVYAGFKKMIGCDGDYPKLGKVGHAPRKTIIAKLDQMGLTEDQLKRMGRWGTCALTRHYLKDTPPHALLASSGVKDVATCTISQSYFSERLMVDVPDDLVELAMPFIGQLKRTQTMLAEMEEGALEGALRLADYPSLGILIACLTKVAMATIRGALELITEYPQHPVFQMAVFKHGQFINLREKYMRDKAAKKFEAHRPVDQSNKEKLVEGLLRGGYLDDLIAAAVRVAQANMAGQGHSGPMGGADAAESAAHAQGVPDAPAPAVSSMHAATPAQTAGNVTSRPASTIPVAATMVPCARGTGAGSAASCPQPANPVKAVLRRGLVTVPQVCTEWFGDASGKGLNGGTPNRTLEERDGDGWRAGDRKFFWERKLIYEEVERLRAFSRKPLQACVRDLEHTRTVILHPCAVAGLQKHLKARAMEVKAAAAAHGISLDEALKTPFTLADSRMLRDARVTEVSPVPKPYVRPKGAKATAKADAADAAAAAAAALLAMDA